MTESPDPTGPSISAVAAESPEESVKKQHEALEDEPDDGSAASEDDSPHE